MASCRTKLDDSENMHQLDAPVDQLIDFSDEKEISVPQALKTLGETDDTFGIFLQSEPDHVPSLLSSPSVEIMPQPEQIVIPSIDSFLDGEKLLIAGSFTDEDKHKEDDDRTQSETMASLIKEEIQSALVDFLDVKEITRANENPVAYHTEGCIDDNKLASSNASAESGILDINNMSTFNLSGCEEMSVDLVNAKLKSPEHQELEKETTNNITCTLEKSPQPALTFNKFETIAPSLQSPAATAVLCSTPDLPIQTCNEEKKETPCKRTLPTLESIRRKVEEIFYYVSPVGGLTAAPEYTHLNEIQDDSPLTTQPLTQQTTLTENNAEPENANATITLEVDVEFSREQIRSPLSKVEHSIHGMSHTPVIQRSRTPLRLVYETENQQPVPTMTAAPEMNNIKVPSAIKIKKHLEPMVSKIGFRSKAPQASVRPLKATFLPSDTGRKVDIGATVPANTIKRNPPTTPVKNQRFIPPIASSSPIVTNCSTTKIPAQPRHNVRSSGYGQPAMNTSASGSVLNTSRIPPPSPRSSSSSMPRYAPSPTRRQSTSSIPSPRVLDKRMSEAIINPPLPKIKKTLGGTGIPRLPTSKTSIVKRSHSFTVNK